MTVFGVHAGLQNTSMEALRSLWRRIESLSFGWISVWDHFYSATLGDDPEGREAVAPHAAGAPRVPGGGGHPRRPGVRHVARAVRLARVLRGLPASGRAGQRHLY